MVGCKSGIATQIQKKEPRVILTHCFEHSLQLAVGDMAREVRNLRDALDTTIKIAEIFAKTRQNVWEIKSRVSSQNTWFSRPLSNKVDSKSGITAKRDWQLDSATGAMGW